MLRSALASCTRCATRALALLALAAAPAALAQWAPTGGPAGARFYEISASDDALFASTFGPLRRYADADGWTTPFDGPGALPVAAGAQVLAPGAGGLLRSTDHGVTFETLPATAGWTPLRPDGDALFALDAGQILQRSDDAGGAWQTVRDSLWVEPAIGGGFKIEVQQVVGAVTDGEAVLAAGSAYVFGGVFRLAPGDTAWTPLYGPTSGPFEEALTPIAFFRHDGALWFFHRRSFDQQTTLVRSIDGGATWTDASAGLPDAAFALGTAVGPAGLYLLTNPALYRWAGAAWETVPPPPEQVYGIASGGALYASSATAVYAYDGAAWAPLPTVIGSSPGLVAAGADGGFEGAVVVQWNGLLRSDDGGASFEPIHPQSGHVAAGGGTLLLRSPDGFVRSDDGGASWEPVAAPALPASFAEWTRPRSLAWDGDTFVAFYGAQRGGEHGTVFETFGAAYRLDGDAWRRISTGLPVGSLGPEPVTSGFALPGGLFVRTDAGCYGLDDGETAWARRTCLDGSDALSVTDMQADGARWIGKNGNGLFASTDRGASWAPLGDGLPDLDGGGLYAASLVPTSAGLLLFYTGTEGAAAARLDGDAWMPLDVAFPAAVELTSFLEGDDGYLYAGSRGSGLWRTPIDFALPIATETGAEAGTLALRPPSPNPARGAVSVSFVLPEPADASLDVLDVLGRRVALLASGQQPAGEMAVQWRADGLAPGLYLVRLQTPDGVRVRRVTVAR